MRKKYSGFIHPGTRTWFRSVLFIMVVVLGAGSARSQNIKILFDATKAETCSNADWVIDADLHNLGFRNGPAVTGQGDESNPAILPTPAQSGITAGTAETYWDGGLSYWGIDCVRRGYHVETLPYNGRITYHDITNAQDLSNYKVFIVCEPNILFTSNEKTAILNFVHDGGSLYMISDHDNSDRNGDGADSPHIWNDLMSTNTVQVSPFGMTFDYVDISQTSTNIATLPGDTLLHGPFGNVAEVQWSNGTTLTLNTTQNPTVRGVVYKTGSSTTGLTNVMCARARYGQGKVAAIGDSSPFDDGTGDPNDQLYTGYTGDAAGNHRKLIMNTTIWLAESDSTLLGINNPEENKMNLRVWPIPARMEIRVQYHLPAAGDVEWQITDLSGKNVMSGNHEKKGPGDYSQEIDTRELPAGLYFLIFSTDQQKQVSRFVRVND